MANLLFKRGSLANLQAMSSYQDGTIYLTTDEPGLYVGIGNECKRIGDFQYFESLTDLEAQAKTGSLTTSALYYVEKDKEGNPANYLLRWNGTAFKWINDTSALSTAIAEVKASADANAAAIAIAQVDIKTINETTIPGVEAKVKAVVGNDDMVVDGANVKSLKDLTTAVSRMASDSTVADLNTKLTQAKKDIDAVEASVAVLNGADTVDGSVAKKIKDAIAAENLSQYATDADVEAVNAKLGGFSETNTVAAAIGSKKEGSTIAAITLWGGVEEAEASANEAKVVADAVSGLVGSTKVSDQIDAKITALDLPGTYDAKGAAATVNEALEAYKTTNDKAVADLDTALDEEIARASAAEKVNSNAIAAIKDGAEVDSFADVEAKLTANAQTAAQAAAQALTDAKAYADGKDSAITAAKNAADAAQAAADAASAKVDTKVGSLSGAVNEKAVTGDDATKFAEAAAQMAYAEAVAHANGLLEASYAMIFKGEVASQDDIDAILAKQSGDTYVVTTKFGDYYPGDLLVWNATENDTGWVHVETGYSAANEQTLSGVVVDNTLTATLAGVSGNNGTIKLAVADNLAMTTSGDVNTINMVWGEF